MWRVGVPGLRGRPGGTALRKAWALSAVIVAVMLALVFTTARGGAATAATTGTPQQAGYRSGVVLVGLRPGVSSAQRRDLRRRGGIVSLRPLTTGSARAVAARPAGRRIGLTFLAVVKPGHEASTIAMLRRDRDVVRFAELDYVMHASGVQRIPNDPFIGVQWGSLNIGQAVTGIRGIRGADDGAAEAWTVTTGRRSIVIGEVDTGVDYLHPDLAANIWTNPGGIGGCPAGTHGYNVVAGSCDPADDDVSYGGHGTHVAGIMGAVGNNRIGVAGMNWSTTILPVKWLGSNAYGSTDQLISALDWLVKAKQAGVNVRVINDSATFVGTPYSQALSDEIDVLGNENILFVTAAGNTSDNNDNPAVRRYPCGYDRLTELCVTATASNDRLPPWANWGAHTVDLAAPGANIYSTLRNGGYGYIDGGSMAAAQVSGAAALILSTANLSTTALRADILSHVDVLPSLAGRVRTGGRLDVCGAIAACARGCKAPRLIGHPLLDVSRTLSNARCRLGRVRRAYSPHMRSGYVISQSRKPGSVARVGTAISILVSKGRKPRR